MRVVVVAQVEVAGALDRLAKSVARKQIHGRQPPPLVALFLCQQEERSFRVVWGVGGMTNGREDCGQN